MKNVSGLEMAAMSKFNKFFPVAFYNDLHPDFSVNFQMNRCYNFCNDEVMLAQLREVSPRIHNYDEFITEFLKLYEKSLTSGNKLRTAYYLRMADFYMKNHPKKDEYRKEFIKLVREHWGIGDDKFFLVA
jgi:hypothetical protein